MFLLKDIKINKVVIKRLEHNKNEFRDRINTVKDELQFTKDKNKSMKNKIVKITYQL